MHADKPHTIILKRVHDDTADENLSHLVSSHRSVHVIPLDPIQEFRQSEIPDGKFMLIIRKIIITVAIVLPLLGKRLMIMGHTLIEEILIAKATA